MFHSKFEVTPEIEHNIISRCDKSCSKQMSIMDVYYDTEDLSLTSNNLWLRKRNDTFELKFPEACLDTSGKASATIEEVAPYIDCYLESSNWAIIVSVINRFTKLEMILPLSVQENSNCIEHPSGILPPLFDVEKWLHQNSIASFAVIQTMRKRYALDLNIVATQGNIVVRVNVDIDEATFVEHENDGAEKCKYSLGEVELESEPTFGCNPSVVMDTVLYELEISNTRAINNVRYPGKVEEYLRRYRPFHYEMIFT